MTTLHLTKHHGAGNDFLVLLDPARQVIVIEELARALCDRRTGLGADGLLHVERPSDGDADFDLTVWNADGSIAETSGNGLRCAAQALVDAGLAPAKVTIRTGGATRRLSVEPETAPGHRQVRVGMGIVRLGDEEPDWVEALGPRMGSSRARGADTGNPHIVMLTEQGLRDIQSLRAVSENARGGPVNAEAIAVVAPDHLRMWVWERGAGETRACGSGSVASAAVARAWGLVGDTVRVSNPGGDLVVELGENNEAFLTGPAKFIARIEVDSTRILT